MHIDCDSFFASCEGLKNPSLKWKYVCVWDEIVIACTYNCKDLGINTWTPIWEARKILKNMWIFLPCDHKYYEQISISLFEFLGENSLKIEPFSIDEAFCEITWIPEYYKLSLEKYLKKLQADILKYIWIPVSIGRAETKIKAKIYSKINKPNWIYIGFDEEKEKALFKELSVAKIPFIWKKSQEKLKYKCRNIYDFLKLWFWELKKIFWKNATDLWLELMWVNAFIVRKNPNSKSISRSRSFNKSMTNNKIFLQNQLKEHFNLVFEEIIEKNMELKHISVFLRKKDFLIISKWYIFPEHSKKRSLLLSKSMELFEEIYYLDSVYRSVWVVFSDLKKISAYQISIFEKVSNKNENENNLYKKINEINNKYNKNIISFGNSISWNCKWVKLWIRK